MKAESNWMSLKQKNTVLGVTSLIYHHLVSRSLVWNELGLSCKTTKSEKGIQTFAKRRRRKRQKMCRNFDSWPPSATHQLERFWLKSSIAKNFNLRYRNFTATVVKRANHLHFFGFSHYFRQGWMHFTPRNKKNIGLLCFTSIKVMKVM